MKPGPSLAFMAYLRITCQFGAFLFGARQFDACQFGAFHLDAVPVRRVSVWRDASLARFTLPRFPFLCLNCTEVFSIFAGRYFRVNSRFAKIFSRENISNSLFAKISSRENNVLYSTLPSAMFVL